MRFYERKKARNYQKLRQRTMSAGDTIHYNKQVRETKSQMEKDVDSPDNDSVFGDSAGSAGEDVFNPVANIRRINISNMNSPESPKVFGASRYETTRIISSTTREHRVSSSSSSSSIREELALLGRSPRIFPGSGSVGARLNLFQRRNLRHRGILSPLR